jgi:hypothetical protein
LFSFFQWLPGFPLASVCTGLWLLNAPKGQSAATD